ncbi:MAG: extracellular solute-binding protein, partial [Chloroflexi bacterium]|nr:extracellular solute-binding protein [Chloroflexota bacterium]
MGQGTRGPRALLALGGVALLLAAAAGCGPSTGGGKTVTVIGTWAGGEQEAFLAMVKPWETQTGNTVKYTGTRDINTVLTTGVASGVLPDLAGLPGPGQMAEYAKAGALKPLDSVLDAATYKSETAKALVDLGTVDGKLTGVFIKAAVKGLIWYNPSVHDYSGAPPATWDDLMSQAAANQGDAEALWCLGLGSGAASGWPGTDWIEDIVLRQAGPA